MADFARAWGAYMSCQTEYHQSQIHKAKKDCGLEIARLDVAYQYAAACKNLCDNTDANDATILDELKKAVDEKLQLLQNRLEIFFVAGIDIPNHYLEQKIQICRLKQ